MKWNADDLELFRKEKEFIDTVLIPFVPIEWGNEMGRTVLEGRFSLIIGEEIEHALKGRIILSPPFTYLKTQSFEGLSNKLREWLQEIKSGGVKHIVFLASDPQFNQTLPIEEEEGVIKVWLPALPIDHMDPKYKQDYLDENIGQVMKKITQAWSPE